MLLPSFCSLWGPSQWTLIQVPRAIFKISKPDSREGGAGGKGEQLSKCGPDSVPESQMLGLSHLYLSRIVDLLETWVSLGAKD